MLPNVVHNVKNIKMDYRIVVKLKLNLQKNDVKEF